MERERKSPREDRQLLWLPAVPMIEAKLEVTLLSRDVDVLSELVTPRLSVAIFPSDGVAAMLKLLAVCLKFWLRPDVSCDCRSNVTLAGTKSLRTPSLTQNFRQTANSFSIAATPSLG